MNLAELFDRMNQLGADSKKAAEEFGRFIINVMGKRFSSLSWQELEEIRQDAFVNMFQANGAGKLPEDPEKRSAYLFAIIQNAALTFGRRRAKNASLGRVLMDQSSSSAFGRVPADGGESPKKQNQILRMHRASEGIRAAVQGERGSAAEAADMTFFTRLDAVSVKKCMDLVYGAMLEKRQERFRANLEMTYDIALQLMVTDKTMDRILQDIGQLAVDADETTRIRARDAGLQNQKRFRDEADRMIDTMLSSGRLSPEQAELVRRLVTGMKRKADCQKRAVPDVSKLEE